MRNFWIAAVAGLALVVYVTTVSFVPPKPTQHVYDPFRPLWTPDVTTNCDTWTIRQSPQAVDDVWPHVDYMTINGEGEYGEGDVIEIPRTSDHFMFAWYADGQQVYHVDATFNPRC